MTKRHTYTHRSQSATAVQIERLVKAIELYDIPAFRIRGEHSTYDRYERTRISRYFDHIQQMVDVFDDRCEYRYSEHLQAFREACQDIGLERDPNGPVCRNERGTAWLSHHHSMNELTTRIRQLTREQWYRRRDKDRSDLAKQQEREITEYADGVMSFYSRTTIIRVDLHYRTEAQARLRVEQVFDDLDALIAKHSRHPTFEHLIGYICAVEQGDRSDGSGYHIHAAYFFNGNVVCRDVWKAIEIGELWEEITRGQGYAHSCNHDKDQYGEACGIGRIQRGNQLIRPHTHKAMKYLVKNGQHLRLKPEGARCLRKGTMRRSGCGD
ncbi:MULTISPECIES: inovirus-type Gp2 protein [Pseudomonas]|uniref:Inovirus Gp2 family protein n=1 Tax=Pseudomonas lactis TaxID=1615674 RepID=A0ABS9FL65_9PSED|nr:MULTISPECIES: inovirus-type Gp2 protein [Pseudomonas]MCF4971275.1 inovirus Gp2 family protein [Pseudomonas lactis]MCF5000899.1 inovirus Gp2 family protein [Pseudomonas lactis]MCF5008752.1 inovirus Gp2 family protein [Pseudomonas lactis]MCF5010675.1 inovirus Gp2 family protein [Pseudomonas lactis]MCF5017081.1 inovirus Gp2 family protein [Pseudomonas lactis]